MLAARLTNAETLSYPVSTDGQFVIPSPKFVKGRHPNKVAAGKNCSNHPNTKQWRTAVTIARIELAHAGMESVTLRRGSELHYRAKKYHDAIKAGYNFRLGKDTNSILYNDRILKEFSNIHVS